MKIEVPWQRFESGLWECQQGDISAAYSADRKEGIRPPFTHDGKTYTNMGGSSSAWRSSYGCHELLPFVPGEFPKVPYSHENEVVKWKGKQYRLGPRVEFVSSERTVDEYRQHFRASYTKGGAFTSNKSYHELLREWINLERWNPDTKGYELSATLNCLDAIDLELAKPDYNKHAATPPQPEPAVEDPSLRQALLFAIGLL